MTPPEIKQNNVVGIFCHTSEPLAGNTVLSAILDSSQKVKSLEVDILDDNNFIVHLDTTGCSVGIAYIDIKVGTVSSEDIAIIIRKSIS